MDIDSVNITTVTGNNRPRNLDTGTNIKAPSRENELNRVGQAGDSGPAVVATFSAAALETSRATSETSQAADDSRLESGSERYEAQPESSEPPPERSRPKIDVMA